MKVLASTAPVCPRHLGHVPREQLLEGTDNSVGKRQAGGRGRGGEHNPKAERAAQPRGTTRERANGNKDEFFQCWFFLRLVKYLTPTH